MALHLFSLKRLNVPYLRALFASLFWLCALILIRNSLRSIPFLPFLFFWTLFFSILKYALNIPFAFASLKTKLFSLHLRMGLLTLLFFACLIGALSALPLFLASALILSFPLFYPLMLKLAFGMKLSAFSITMIILGALACLLSFNLKLSWGNFSLFLAVSSSFLLAALSSGYGRLTQTEPFFRIWFYQSLITLSFSAPLLIKSWPSFDLLYLLEVALAALCLLLVDRLLRPAKKSSLSSSCSGLVFFSSSFALSFLGDLVFFKNIPPLKSALCSILILFLLFLLFFQKNNLRNPLFKL